MQWLCCLLLLPLLALLTGCERPPELVKLSGLAMGTQWHVTYRVPADTALSSQHVSAGIAQQLERVEQSMSNWRQDSEISAFNRAAVAQWLPMSEDFATVLEAALEVGEGSSGSYDVTVAPLVDLWGFGPGGGLQQRSAPPREKIDALLALVDQTQLEVDTAARLVRKTIGLTVDFSSIAKGYGVDQVADWLSSQRIGDYLVEVGGELRLAGEGPRGGPWRIAIEKPEVMSSGVAQAIQLTNLAVATSGDYRNFFEMNGQRYSHSIDPRSGYPVAHDLVSVTVLHPSAMLADAWATALTVMGPEQAMAVANTQGLAVYFIQRSGDEYQVSSTPAFAPYIAPYGETYRATDSAADSAVDSAVDSATEG